MKKIYGISFLIAAVVLTGAYYMSYQYSVNKARQDQLAKEEQEQNEALNASKSDGEVVTNQTRYTLQSFDSKEGTIREEEQPMPADFLGKTRQELIDYLDQYSSNPSEEDKEKGFESFELIYFSSEAIILRKSFLPPEGEQRYCLVEEDGFVVVYNGDMESIYAYTDIKLKNLPADLQSEIKAGKYITETKELYDFLENYSS